MINYVNHQLNNDQDVPCEKHARLCHQACSSGYSINQFQTSSECTKGNFYIISVYSLEKVKHDMLSFKLYI